MDGLRFPSLSTSKETASEKCVSRWSGCRLKTDTKCAVLEGSLHLGNFPTVGATHPALETSVNIDGNPRTAHLRVERSYVLNSGTLAISLHVLTPEADGDG